jgi:threonine dehydratase
LLAGVATYLKGMGIGTKTIGFEPLGSPSMYNALKENKVVVLKEL